jgi:hypothetical protein
MCSGGPISYGIVPGSGVTQAFIVDHVMPKIKAKFGGDVAYVFGTALLWVLHSPFFIMMPSMLRDDIRSAYADVKPKGFNENPMQKDSNHYLQMPLRAITQAYNNKMELGELTTTPSITPSQWAFKTNLFRTR